MWLWSCDLCSQYTPSKANSRVPGLASGGSVIPNQHRSAMTFDPRRSKGTPVESNSRAARAATARRPAAKSPSPTEMDPHTEENSTTGLVISNRQDPAFPHFLDKEEEEEEDAGFDDADGDRVLDDLNKEDDDTLSFLIDRRLLHKDFIVDKFSLAQVYFRKVSMLSWVLIDV